MTAQWVAVVCVCNDMITLLAAMPAEPAALSVIAPRVISTDGATAEDTMKLEDVTPGAQITGISGDAPVTVVATTWIGGNALRLTYRTASQKLDERLLYRDHEPRLELAKRSAAYDLTADAATFKLAAEALRIRMAGAVRPDARGPHLRPRTAPAPDPGRLRRADPADPAEVPARRRPRRRQDDHGGPLYQGADAPR